ncbi:MAG TPA: cell wall hydrolase [Roseiarcus sp.]|nr:cell wall hydrolase [Roseiarcus sp.]
MGRSRLSWAASAVAPWCLAAGVLVSITADAGQEPAQYASAFDRKLLIEANDPVRKAIALSRRFQAVDADGAPVPLVQTGQAGSAARDEIEPNAALKDRSSAAAEANESAKGDPFAGVEASLAARRGGSSGDVDLDALPSWPPEVQGPRDVEFDPGHTMSPAQPAEAKSAPATPAFSDGATPSVPLEFALNSSSPTSSDGVVVAVEIDGHPQTTFAEKSPLSEPPNYAALIDPKDNARQMRCLAEAIYFEARSESEEGQAAVAQVVLNRVRSGIYPTTVCGVVYQDRNRPFACQFSFACEGRSLRIEEPSPWAVATRIAQEVVSGRDYNPRVAEAVNYHANYVAPFWRGYLRRVDRIGAHIFYAMRDGVNWAPGALNGHGDRP